VVRSFVNRDEELNFLNEKWQDGRRQLIVLYGRRRTGKTELINHFSQGKNSLYFLADERSIEDNLDRFASKAAQKFEDVKPEVENFDELFQYIKQRAGEPIVIAVDEFSYLVETDDTVPSVFQRVWDETLEGENVFLILCGSSISLMQEGVLSYESPLYGRRTGQWKLESLKFEDARKFFPERFIEEQIKFYSVLGGIPAYLQKFDPEEDLRKNIRDEMLSKGTFLYEEPEFLLRQSLRKPSRYMEILEEMAYGATKTSEIANKVGMETSNISPYLNKLKELELIEKKTPVTAGENSRGIHKVSDDFFRFYFRFIYSNRSELESHKAGKISENVSQKLSSHTSHTFERVCRELTRKTSDCSKVGGWWYKEDEIDIVALNETENTILFGECKWTKQKVGKKLLGELENKTENVRWKNKNRKEKFALFSKSGFTDELHRVAESRPDLNLYSLEDLNLILTSENQ
jgi:AAA+ ATPase superfamily predicted ATPase